MPESLLDRRLKLGTFLGIGLYVHWSFMLVVAYVAITTRAGGPTGMAFGIAQLLGVFFCVTLHEYGHAMAARRFGIGTADITLLPIGGVARLQRMPRIPWQELVVAVAGPAVNVVIAVALLVGFVLFSDANLVWAFWAGTVDQEMVNAMFEMLTSPSLIGFAILMLIVNVMLVLFNMIPAFPMDGGRVFRSVMAMGMDYRRATMIASRVGLLCAVLMAFFALSTDPPNPVLVLIALFIGYAGIAEARQVDVMEQVRGLTPRQVMIQVPATLPIDTPLDQVADQWKSTSLAALPVVAPDGMVVGMLRLADVARAIAAGTDATSTAGQLVNYELTPEAIGVDEELEGALTRTGKHFRQIPVVDDVGRLLGVVDLDSMLARGEISKHRDNRPGNDAARFDETN